MAEPVLSRQQGKEAEHGHPTVQPLAMGVEPKAGQAPLGHQAWLKRRRGGGHWGGGSQRSAVLAEQAFFLETLEGTGIRDVLFGEFLTRLRASKGCEVSAIFDAMAAAGGLQLGFRWVIENRSIRLRQRHVHGVIRAQVGGAAVASVFLAKDVGMGQSLRLELLVEAAEASTSGMRRPMITFSLRPRSQSLLPSIAASVRTRVVSWKEAAEMKLSVFSEALVTQQNRGEFAGHRR